MIAVTELPLVNALLNGTSATFLSAGYYFVRRKNISAHRRCMILALCSSLLFLISYLTYHYQVGSVRYQRGGWIRLVYFSILLTHTVLAAAIVPLVLVTVTRALKGRYESHRRIARWTLPLWVYVSVTGVIIYWMLYH